MPASSTFTGRASALFLTFSVAVSETRPAFAASAVTRTLIRSPAAERFAFTAIASRSGSPGWSVPATVQSRPTITAFDLGAVAQSRTPSAGASPVFRSVARKVPFLPGFTDLRFGSTSRSSSAAPASGVATWMRRK